LVADAGATVAAAGAGALGSGLFAASLAALAFKPSSPWPALSPTALVVLALALLTAGLLVRAAPRAAPAPLATAARLLALIVACIGLAGLIARWGGSVLAEAPGADAQAGRLAVVRSAVLAAAAIVLAAWRAAGGRRELVPLAWIVLGLGGLKLLVEDLRVGDAAHLVMSLACYGVALIVVPALGRRVRVEASDPPPG
jgi:hypothetical protein